MRLRPPKLWRGLPPEVLALSAINFCVALGFGIVAPVLPVFARSFGVSATAATAVISVFAFMRLISAPVAGKMLNRLGEPIVLASGLMIVAVSSLFAGLAQSYVQLLLLRGVGGLGSAMFTVSSMALVVRVVPPQMRGRAAGANQGGFLLGGVAGPAVGGLVVGWSIRAPFFVYAATLFAGTLVAVLVLGRMRKMEQVQQLAEQAAQVGAGASGSSARAAAGGKQPGQLMQALRLRSFRAALAVNLTNGYSSFGLRSSILPLFVVEALHRSPSVVGFGLLCSAGLQAILLLPAGKLADTRGRRPAMLYGLLGSGVGMVLLTATSMIFGDGTESLGGLLGFFVSVTIFGAGYAFLGSAPAAMVGDIATTVPTGGTAVTAANTTKPNSSATADEPTESPATPTSVPEGSATTARGNRSSGGTVFAAYQMVSDIGSIAGPLVAGILLDATGSFSLAFITGIGAALAAALLVRRAPETLVPAADTKV